MGGGRKKGSIEGVQGRRGSSNKPVAEKKIYSEKKKNKKETNHEGKGAHETIKGGGEFQGGEENGDLCQKDTKNNPLNQNLYGKKKGKKKKKEGNVKKTKGGREEKK